MALFAFSSLNLRLAHIFALRSIRQQARSHAEFSKSIMFSSSIHLCGMLLIRGLCGSLLFPDARPVICRLRQGCETQDQTAACIDRVGAASIISKVRHLS